MLKVKERGDEKRNYAYLPYKKYMDRKMEAMCTRIRMAC